MMNYLFCEVPITPQYRKTTSNIIEKNVFKKMGIYFTQSDKRAIEQICKLKKYFSENLSISDTNPIQIMKKYVLFSLLCNQKSVEKDILKNINTELEKYNLSVKILQEKLKTSTSVIFAIFGVDMFFINNYKILLQHINYTSPTNRFEEINNFLRFNVHYNLTFKKNNQIMSNITKNDIPYQLYNRLFYLKKNQSIVFENNKYQLMSKSIFFNQVETFRVSIIHLKNADTEQVREDISEDYDPNTMSNFLKKKYKNYLIGERTKNISSTSTNQEDINILSCYPRTYNNVFLNEYGDICILVVFEDSYSGDAKFKKSKLQEGCILQMINHLANLI